jgi:hypothetical protein
VNNPGIERLYYCSGDQCPETPEQTLGLPPGTLDHLRTVVEPAFLIHGIYYYSGTAEIKSDFAGSTGILIVHNHAYTGRIKNLHGDFSGLIISDKIVHVNANAKIIGVVVTLATASGGNAFGNGNSDILYSSEVIGNLISTVSFATDTSYAIVSWKQVR